MDEFSRILANLWIQLLEGSISIRVKQLSLEDFRWYAARMRLAWYTSNLP